MNNLPTTYTQKVKAWLGMKDNKDLALANQIHDKITQISSMESDSPEILKQTLDVMDQKQQANNKVKLNRYSDYGIYACEKDRKSVV